VTCLKDHFYLEPHLRNISINARKALKSIQYVGDELQPSSSTQILYRSFRMLFHVEVENPDLHFSDNSNTSTLL